MTSRKFTLDRIEKGLYVFLLKEDESKQLEIPIEQVSTYLKEGDIVAIDEDGIIEVLNEESKVTIDKVQSLIEKLKKNR